MTTGYSDLPLLLQVMVVVWRQKKTKTGFIFRNILSLIKEKFNDDPGTYKATNSTGDKSIGVKSQLDEVF